MIKIITIIFLFTTSSAFADVVCKLQKKTNDFTLTKCSSEILTCYIAYRVKEKKLAMSCIEETCLDICGIEE